MIANLLSWYSSTYSIQTANTFYFKYLLSQILDNNLDCMLLKLKINIRSINREKSESSGKHYPNKFLGKGGIQNCLKYRIARKIIWDTTKEENSLYLRTKNFKLLFNSRNYKKKNVFM